MSRWAYVAGFVCYDVLAFLPSCAYVIVFICHHAPNFLSQCAWVANFVCLRCSFCILRRACIVAFMCYDILAWCYNVLELLHVPALLPSCSWHTYIVAFICHDVTVLLPLHEKKWQFLHLCVWNTASVWHDMEPCISTMEIWLLECWINFLPLVETCILPLIFSSHYLVPTRCVAFSFTVTSNKFWIYFCQCF